MIPKSVEVCFTPYLIPLFDLSKTAVVVIDVYRATSAITAALGSGVASIIPVATVEEAKEYRTKGFKAAAERKGIKVPGFDLGNSPLHYMDPSLKGQTVVMTTSNGTKALLKAKEAKELLIGSFLNETAIVNYIATHHQNVMFICAGWKDRFNLEDSLVAGSMAQKLLEMGWTTVCDSALAAMHLNTIATEKSVRSFMSNASHTLRLGHLKLDEDIEFCNQKDKFDVVPKYVNGAITL